MQIKGIKIYEEIKDINCDTIDVVVESETGYAYTIVVSTPNDLIAELNEEGTNFLAGRGPTLFVRQLTEEIIMEAVQAYAADDAYWLKLYQFADSIDISVLNQMQKNDEEGRELFELEGLDLFFYYFQKYAKVSPGNRVLLEPVFLMSILTLIFYCFCFLKPELFDLFSSFIGSDDKYLTSFNAIFGKSLNIFLKHPNLAFLIIDEV